MKEKRGIPSFSDYIRQEIMSMIFRYESKHWQFFMLIQTRENLELQKPAKHTSRSRMVLKPEHRL